MAEYKLFDGDVPYVSTPDFHAHRERAPHLEQPVHQPRLLAARMMVVRAASKVLQANPARRVHVTDLGCGDGGLLSLLKDIAFADAHGYDFQPSNTAGWAERQVDAELADVFGADRDQVELGEVAICTEVLEHVADPHGAVRWIGQHSQFLIASSPWNETPASHDECHAWAWDQDGYRALIEQGGYRVVRHETVGQFQVILGGQQ